MSTTLTPVASELLDALQPSERKVFDAIQGALATRLTEAQQSQVAATFYERPTPHVEYQSRPIDWIVEKLGVPRHTLEWELNGGYDLHQWDGTREPLLALAQGLVKWQNVGVEAGTATNKTFTAACLGLWFLACFEDAFIPTIAPKEDQLSLNLWKEVGQLWPRFQAHFPQAERTFLRIRMIPGSDKWSMFGFVAGVRAEEVETSASKARGLHAEHMLIIIEEMTGVHPAVVRALRDTSRAPHNMRLGLGNPDHQLDQLHQFCLSPRTIHIRISALDHPNVVSQDPALVPGAVSQQGIEEAREEDPDGVEGRVFQAKVRGISPKEAKDALIRWAWCERAAQLWAEDNARVAAGQPSLFRTGRRGKGIDVANSESGDKAAIADGDGAFLESVRSFPCPDANLLGLQVYREMLGLGPAQLIPERPNGAPDDWLPPFSTQPANTGVDSIGVGAGTINELARLMGGRYLVNAFVAGAHAFKHTEKSPDGTTFEWAPDAGSFENLRAQALWNLREDLRQERIAIPPDKRLWRQLTAFTFEQKPGKVVVEPTKKIKERIGSSPDDAMATCIWNWVRPRAAVVIEQAKPTPVDQDPYALDEPPDDGYGSSTMSQFGYGF